MYRSASLYFGKLASPPPPGPPLLATLQADGRVGAQHLTPFVARLHSLPLNRRYHAELLLARRLDSHVTIMLSWTADIVQLPLKQAIGQSIVHRFTSFTSSFPWPLFFLFENAMQPCKDLGLGSRATPPLWPSSSPGFCVFAL